MAKLIDKLTEAVTELNQRYIEKDDLSLDQYRAMVAELIIDLLLIELGYEINEDTRGFSFYSDPAIGYTGYITIADKTLFFAPTKAIILSREAASRPGVE